MYLLKMIIYQNVSIKNFQNTCFKIDNPPKNKYRWKFIRPYIRFKILNSCPSTPYEYVDWGVGPIIFLKNKLKWKKITVYIN